MNRTTKEIHEDYEKFNNVFALNLLEAPDKDMVNEVVEKRIHSLKLKFIESFFESWKLEDLLKMKHLILENQPEPDKKPTSRKGKQKRGKSGLFVT